MIDRYHQKIIDRVKCFFGKHVWSEPYCDEYSVYYKSCFLCEKKKIDLEMTLVAIDQLYDKSKFPIISVRKNKK